jgi:flagellar FliL protein
MSKLVKIMLSSLAILLIAALALLIVVLNVEGNDEDGELTIDEVVEYSYQTPEVTTDLADGSFVQVQFQILTDSEDAKEEIGKRDFQLVNILIKELAVMNEDEFKEDLDSLEATVKERLNEVMIEGSVTDVYTINKILQ